MGLNKYKICIVVFAVLLLVSGCSNQEIDNGNLYDNNGIYILYKDNNSRIQYLTEDFQEIKDIAVRGAWDLCSAGDNKIYTTIAGDASMVGDSVKVLKNGKVIKTIDLKYDMPLNIKYNSYDKKAYVTHKYKGKRSIIDVFPGKLLNETIV